MAAVVPKFLRQLRDVLLSNPADGEVLTFDEATETWVNAVGGGGGAPTDAGYLVTAAHAELSAEVPVGAAPGGELGGTWAAPTVDAVHSGSSHAQAQAAAEATAAAADAAHVAAADPHAQYQKESEKGQANGYAELDASGDVPDAQIPATITRDSEAVLDGDPAGGVLSGTYPNPGFAADMATQAELDAHVADATAAHAASAIGVTPAGGLAADDVQEALQELDTEKAPTAHSHAGEDITSGTIADARIAATIARDSEVTAAVDAHVNDAADAHDASAISFAPAGTIAATDVQAAIEEVASEAGGGGGLYDAYAYLRDEKAEGTQGGSSVAGSWLSRVLNTEVSDEDGIVTLSANEFTLQPGTYRIAARAPIQNSGISKLRLRNITDGVTVGVGGSQNVANNHCAWADVSARIVVSGSAKAFALQYRSTGSQATSGLGTVSDFDEVEVFAEVEIWRFA